LREPFLTLSLLIFAAIVFSYEFLERGAVASGKTAIANTWVRPRISG
jgi:hypothetical protein